METKKIVSSLLMLASVLACGAAAAQNDRQQDQNARPQGSQDTQTQTDRAILQSDAAARSHRNDAAQDEKMKREKERSTGKEAVNPAANPPRTPAPPKLSDPTSTPLKN
jgi:Ni/Co efflux regulator RcnB